MIDWGTRLMEYSTGRKIGRGGFGTVYEAFDSDGNRYAAKVVEDKDPHAVELLKQQFDFLSSLDHKRIVRAIDFKPASPRGPTMIVEMVAGVDLKTYVETSGSEHLPAIIAQVIDGLRYLHNLGRVHGDIKPDSIIVYEENGRPEVKLIDAGLDGAGGGGLPKLVGTPAYMAPEIIRNLDADGRSDLYSLGVTVYEILAGENPFACGDRQEVLRRQIEHQPPPLSRIVQGLDQAWDAFVAGLMEKEPLLRFKDADAAGAALERVVGVTGFYSGNLSPPRPNPMAVRPEMIDRVMESLAPSGMKAVLLYGEPGCGSARLLERAGARARAEGREVFSISLQAGLPALARLVEGVLGPKTPEAEAGAAGTAFPADVAARLGPIVDCFRTALGSDREYLIVVDGGENMEAGELRLLAALVVEMKGRLGLVVGREAGNGSAPQGSEGYVVIHVSPLDSEEVARAIAMHFGTPGLPSELAEEIFHCTGGNADLLGATLDRMWKSKSISLGPDSRGIKLEWDGRLEPPVPVERVVDRGLVAGLSPAALETLKALFASEEALEKEVLSRWLTNGDPDAALSELLDTGLVARTDHRLMLVTGRKPLEGALGLRANSKEVACISRELAAILEGRAEGAYDSYRLGLLYLQGRRHSRAFSLFEDAGGRFAGFSVRDALLAYRKALECRVGRSRLARVSERAGDLKLERGELESATQYYEAASSERASSRRKLGWVLGLRGRFDESTALLEECEETAARTGDRIERAHAWAALGYILAMQSRQEASLEALERAKEVFEAEGMNLEAGLALHRMAFAEWKAFRLEFAVPLWEEAREHFARSGDRKRGGLCVMSLALCRWKQMRFDEAERLFEQALTAFTEIGAVAEKASCRQNYALLLLDRGRLEEAAASTGEALAIAGVLGRQAAVDACTTLLAAIALERGNWQEAETTLRGLAGREPAPGPFQGSMITRYLALAACMAGRFDDAETLVEESRRLALEAHDSDGLGQALLARAVIMVRKDAGSPGVEAAREALDKLRACSSMVVAHDAHRALGEALCATGELEPGIEALTAALEGFKTAPGSLHAARALRALAAACLARDDLVMSRNYIEESVDICRRAGARYDHGLALLVRGRQAFQSGRLLEARRSQVEAGCIFKALKIDDLYREAMNEMEKVTTCDPEAKAVKSLSEISQTLNSSYDLPTVLNLAMDLAIEYLGAERGVLMIKDEATGELTTYTQRAMDEESLEEVMGISRSIVESVRKTGEPVIAEDASQDERFKDSRSVRIHNIMSVMCVPLSMQGKDLGLIYLDSREVSSGFTALETEFVKAFANQASSAIANARLVGSLYDSIADLKVRSGKKYSFENFIGPGERMQDLFRLIDKAARSDLRILITGESGTGKQLVFELIHELSGRLGKAKIQVNCGAIAKDLTEAELFGIEDRVATGVSPRSGFFERAEGGTIFLDEIGDMPAGIQMKVLRVLGEREFERVGGSKTIKSDVRVITATNKDIKQLVEQGRFRSDLYYRLNELPIHVPALRERIEDLPYLVDHFLAKYADVKSKPNLRMSKEAMAVLRGYHWPGNVRELEACIQRAIVKAEGPEILVEHLPEDVLDSLKDRNTMVGLGLDGTGGSFRDTIRRVEKRLIEDALRKCHGNVSRTAQMLGMKEATLRRKIRALGIKNIWRKSRH
jgi:Nif-specific regulatory protein